MMLTPAPDFRRTQPPSIKECVYIRSHSRELIKPAILKRQVHFEKNAKTSTLVSNSSATQHSLSLTTLLYSVFVDAPHILLPGELDAPSEELAALQSNPDTAMRGWWTANEERTKVSGLHESLLFIRRILKNQRFDVRLIAFWQFVV